ncbi:MAG: DUF354 domain-containing protein [Bacteroidota bacterium]|nr:DUF354 domain-containing protein [Bacteroidota bacterium]MDP3144339.1 DUF354 domain-containing protein [Bacteroidota bacterium]
MPSTLKILIDIGHPAHVHYFKNMIVLMQEKGHSFLVVARDKEITHQLLNAYKIPYVSRGKGGAGLIGKLFYAIKADFFVFKKAIKFKPDILLSFGSPYAAHVSQLIFKPHISVTDTEHAKLGIMAFAPFTETILTPDVFQKDFGKKQVRFKSYIEFTYLHDSYFKPDLNIKEELGIEANKKFVLFRYISWGASHDIGQSGISDEVKKELIALFENKGYTILISSEGKLNAFFQPYQIKIAPEKIHNVLHAADFFIGESGTMATEAALLGTPSVFVNSLNAGVFEDEVKHQVLYSFRNTHGLTEKIVELLKEANLKSKLAAHKNKLHRNKINTTAFLVWFLENYPNSKHIMQKDITFQDKFIN